MGLWHVRTKSRVTVNTKSALVSNIRVTNSQGLQTSFVEIRVYLARHRLAAVINVVTT